MGRDGEPLDPEDWAVVRAVKKGETSLKEVLEIECFDGTRKTILNSAVPLKSGDGRISGVVVLNEDITERVEAEQALRRSEARYRSYIEVTGQMGWATNADGEVVDDAPGFRRIHGPDLRRDRGAGAGQRRFIPTTSRSPGPSGKKPSKKSRATRPSSACAGMTGSTGISWPAACRS